MNTFSRFLSVAVVATLTSVGAQAAELDPAQFATQFEGNRTRAEVAEIPNRRGHDVQAGRKPLRVHCNRCIASDRQCSKSAIALR